MFVKKLIVSEEAGQRKTLPIIARDGGRKGLRR